MRIEILSVHNFRSISDLTLHCDTFQTLLGPNNHGKSNVLAALEFFLTSSAKPRSEDLCEFRAAGTDEIWVEAKFVDLTEQEKTTFTKYLDATSCVRIRKRAQLGPENNFEVSYHGHVEEPTDWWLQSSALERIKTKELLTAEAAQIPQLLPLTEEKGRLTREKLDSFQTKYVQDHKSDLTFVSKIEDSPLLGPKTVASGVLPDFYMVPAVRDLSDEVKAKGTTTFARLLQRAIREMAETDPAYAEIRSRLEALVGAFNSDGSETAQSTPLRQIEKAVSEELASWGVTASIEVLPPDIEQLFELGTELHLDDGVKTKASQKGHGLQRAVIFALVRSWANALRNAKSENSSIVPRKASDSVIFAFEEPELFLHPQAQRRLVSALKQISDAPQHQVFICTHSSHFIDLTLYKSIAIISKQGPKTTSTIRQCREDLFEEGVDNRKRHFQLAAWINPDRGELFFAKKVILVEGDTESAALPYLSNRLACHDPEISVVNCGSKYNLHLYIKLLKAYRIPYIVVHDEDPVPEPFPAEWNEDKRREKTNTFNLNQEIQALVAGPLGIVSMVSPDFEGLVGVSATQAKKKGKPLAAIDYLESIETENLSDALKNLVRNAYAFEAE